MGTSKSNPGLKPSSLLPPWASPPPSQGEEQEGHRNEDGSQPNQPAQNPNTQGDWRSAKRDLTAYTKASTTGERRSALKKAARSYVRGSGGSGRSSSAAVSGKMSGIKLGSVLGGIASEGIRTTFQRFGLGDVSNLSIEGAFNKLAQHICSDGATTEESIANVAVVSALSQLYEEFDLENNDLESLDSLSSDQINEILQCYVSAYIYEKWLHELGMSIEGKNDIDINQIVSLEEDIKEFINSSISLEFDDRDLTTIDFEQGEGKEIVDSIFQQAYEQIETL